MFNILLIGLNHQTAPVELRECLAFTPDESEQALLVLKDHPLIEEALVLSTCNRVEVLTSSSHRSQAINTVKMFLADFNDVPTEQFDQALYVYEGSEAVRHLFRVAASLDSLILGEPQILGQIKTAYRTATQLKTSGVILNRLLHKAFFVAKRVRSETGIGDNAVSISYAAIELAGKIFGELKGKQALLIGAGEMAELAVEHLIRHKIDKIFVANRTFERGVELATRFKGQAVHFDEIIEMLKQVDIIISSTGSADFIIKRNQVKGMMRLRKNRPLFFIDIAVPRDIDPQINRLTNFYVYDIDDLQGVIEENLEERQQEAIKGERIVDEAVIQFRKWYDTLDIVPTIVNLRNKIDGIASQEIDKTLLSLNHLSASDQKALLRMKEALINKILHDPTVFLKSNGCQKDKSLYVDTIRKLFKLDD
jgi:glutamyl-tRNA reductase